MLSKDRVITLNGVPPSLNEFAGRTNSHQYREQKEYWTQYVQAVCCQRFGPRKGVRPYGRAIVEISYTFPDHRRRDPDNYCGKFLLDGLTKSGLIVDDSFDHIKLVLGANPTPGRPCTQITVKEE